MTAGLPSSRPPRQPRAVLKISLLTRSPAWVISPMVAVLLGLAAVVLIARPDLSAGAWLASALLGAAIGVIALLHRSLTRFEVGSDGVSIRHRGRRRFLRFGELDQVLFEGSILRFVLRDAAAYDVFITIEGRSADARHGDYLEQCRALVARIHQEIALEREGHAAAEARPAAAVLMRGARAALVGIREAHGYRAPLVERPEALWRVAEDAAAPPDARGAAVVQLARAADDGTRARLRLAAEETASPELGRLFSAALGGKPDDEIAAALDEVERAARGAHRE